jgi:hypothetical protein
LTLYRGVCARSWVAACPGFPCLSPPELVGCVCSHFQRLRVTATVVPSCSAFGTVVPSCSATCCFGGIYTQWVLRLLDDNHTVGFAGVWASNVWVLPKLSVAWELSFWNQVVSSPCFCSCGISAAWSKSWTFRNFVLPSHAAARFRGAVCVSVAMDKPG